MNMSFGIVTQNKDFSNANIMSLLMESLKKDDEAIIADTDEKLTVKKNNIAKQAKNDILVILHDYVSLSINWRRGFEEFGYDWDVAMCKIATMGGYRFRDWVLWDSDLKSNPPPDTIKFIDYNDSSQTNRMYVSGALMIVKKEYLLKNPLDESLDWGQGEDVEWSLRCRETWNYKMNPYSLAMFTKHKDCWPPSPGKIL